MSLSSNVVPFQEPPNWTSVYNTTNGAATVSANQLVGGYVYNANAGAAVALTLPTVAQITTALGANVLPPEGFRVGFTWGVPLLVNVGDANNLTLTPGTGLTIVGAAAVNNTTARFTLVYTGDTTAVLVRA